MAMVLALIGNLYPVPEVRMAAAYIYLAYLAAALLWFLLHSHANTARAAILTNDSSRFGLSGPRFLFFIFLENGAPNP